MDRHKFEEFIAQNLERSRKTASYTYRTEREPHEANTRLAIKPRTEVCEICGLETKNLVIYQDVTKNKKFCNKLKRECGLKVRGRRKIR